VDATGHAVDIVVDQLDVEDRRGELVVDPCPFESTLDSFRGCVASGGQTVLQFFE
jgi:hypothetical protein